MELNSGEHSLVDNTQHRVLRINTVMLNIDYEEDIDTDIEQENLSITYVCITKLQLCFTGFPCPYIGYEWLRLCVNCFLSLSPSHYCFFYYAFTPALPVLPLRATPLGLIPGLSARLKPFILGHRRLPTLTTIDREIIEEDLHKCMNIVLTIS